MSEDSNRASRHPSMSVIVLTSGDPEQAGPALESLRQQSIAGQLELILIRFAPEYELPYDPAKGFRGAQVIEDDGRSFGEVRAEAVRSASAEVVAFLEDHCLAEPHWAEALLRDVEEGWDGVGCEMYNASAGIGISDAVALMNYAPWLAPAVRGQVSMIPGHNAAYRKAVLLDLGPSLGPLMRSDSALNMKLAADGHRLLLEPAAKVAHANEVRLPSIMRGYYYNTRSMSATRSVEFEWGAATRCVRILLWPLVPVSRLAKLYGYLLRRRRDLLGSAIKWSPVMFLAWTATGLGQAVGLAFGLGDADVQFLRYEATQLRPVNFGGWNESSSSTATQAV